MKNLMKYEFRKTLFTKLMVLGLTAMAQIAFLIGLYGDNERVLAAGVVLLTLLAFGGITVIGLASVVILHRDMNTKQSYMLFMTPNSSYKILGAKMLENGLSILLGGAFFFALGALDITLLFGRQGLLNELWNTLREMLQTIDSRITLDYPTMLALTANILATWISTVSCAYLGVVISTALFSGRRWSGFVSFLIILALLWLTGFIQLKGTAPIEAVRTVFLADAAIAMGLSAVMYLVTVQIMERKLSV